MGVLAESVRKYNAEPMIPCWGFGARFNGTPYHIFQCGSSSQNNGSRALLHAYHAAFQTALEFGYETRYDEVIQAAAHHSKKQLVRTMNDYYALYGLMTCLFSHLLLNNRIPRSRATAWRTLSC